MAGALFGLLFGGYIANYSYRKVVDFHNMVHPAVKESAQDRYFIAIIAGFVFVLSAIGPYFAFGKFGRWVDDAIYGFLKTLSALAIVTIFLLILQGPTDKFSYYNWTYIASRYWVPLIIILGPIIGILYGKVKRLESLIANHDLSGQDNFKVRSDKDHPFFETVSKGILGGILLGLFSGYYFANMSFDFVFDNQLLNKNPDLLEEIYPDYIFKVTLEFTLVCGFLGAYVAFGIYDRLIKHAFNGLIGCIILIVIIRMTSAYLLNEYPFSSYPFRFKVTEKFLLPVTILLGPPIGIMIGMCFRFKPDSTEIQQNPKPDTPEMGQTT